MLMKNPDFIQGIEVKKTRVNDVEIAYRIFGQGHPLLMIMGFGGNMEVWQPDLLEELSRNFRVIIFDNRGIGESTATDREFTIELFAEDTVGLMNALNIGSAYVMGFSMGTMIALQMAVDFPGKIDKLVLYAAECGGKEALPHSKDVWAILEDTSMPLEEKHVKTLRILLPEKWRNEHPSPAEYFPPVSVEISMESMNRQFKAITDWKGCYDKLGKIDKSTLLVAGADDMIIPPGNLFIIGEQIPSSWVVQLRGCGHGMMYQEPGKLCKVVSTFLEI
ncbi:MAG: alpha/beta hydrolase [Candidatus Eremiobacteraeota bacterium]|nr:alpha/beta hydrolase [Candidatus Eremiobacteraeota bacterium]